MNLSIFLQIIISLVFIYLILSLVVSELQEQLTAFLEFRARNLKKAIEIFLGEKVAKDLYGQENSLFSAYNQYTNQWNEKSLFGISLFGKSLGPSYIDPKVFAESLVTLINGKLVDENKLQLNDLLVYASENSLPETPGQDSSSVSRRGVIAKLQTIQKTICLDYLVTLDTQTLSNENKLQLNNLLVSIHADEKLSNENSRAFNDLLLKIKNSAVSQHKTIEEVQWIEEMIKGKEEYQKIIPKFIEIANITKLKHNEPTLTDFIDEIATTFSQIMERTSGVYKRNAKGISLLFGLFTAGLFNIDTLYIVDQLYKNPVLRDSFDAAATKVVEQNQPCFDAARKLTKPEEIATEEQKCGEELKSNIDTLKASADFPPLPVGWKDGNIGNFYSQPTAVFGWLISAIAISMGAPFWFDLLSKVINVRNTVKSVMPPNKPVDEE
jgi:hypothetical protein